MNRLSVKDMIGQTYEFNYNNSVSTSYENIVAEKASNPICTREGYFIENNPPVIQFSKQQPIVNNIPKLEFSVSLVADQVNVVTYYQTRKGNLLPFMNVIACSGKIVKFDALYDREHHYEFTIKARHQEDKVIELTESQFKKPEEIINQFQLQAHVLFACNGNDKSTGELLKRYLSALLACAKIICAKYYPNPIIDLKKDLDSASQQNQLSFNKQFNKTNDDPVSSVKEFMAGLLMLKDTTHCCIFASWPVTTLILPFLGEYQEQLKLLVIEGDSTKRIKIAQRLLDIYPTNSIASLDNHNEIKEALIKSHNECVLLTDVEMNRTYRKKIARENNIANILELHQWGANITKELLSSKTQFIKELDTSIIFISNSIRYENFIKTSIVGIELNVEDIDEDQYYKTISNKYFVSNLYSHFISYCATYYEDMLRFLKDKFLQEVSDSKFLQHDMQFTYSAILTGLSWFERFIKSCDIDITDYLGNYRSLLKSFFMENDNTDICGYSLLFHRILQKMYNEGNAKKLPLSEIISEQPNDALRIFYDNNNIYFFEKELASKICSYLPEHIKLNRILADLKERDYLITYKGSSYYTIKVTSPDGSGTRKTMIQIKKSFIDDELSDLY